MSGPDREDPLGVDGALVTSDAYRTLLEDLKARVRTARVGAVLAANAVLLRLYWDLGHLILERQAAVGHGGAVVRRLARDLRAAFPDMRGLSYTNLNYMRAFAAAWPSPEIFQQPVGKIPWGQNLVLLDKLDDPEVRQFYADQCVEHGWSRAVLMVQIERGLHERQGRALTNFEHALPPPASDLARDALKDPYVFDFLALSTPASERELEGALVDHVQRFLLELGVGFAFVGRQVRLEVGGDEFFLDLLFYHLKLRCFVVIELKAVPFQPEFVGKLNFYQAAIDRDLRHPQDGPTIGLLLCKDKNRVVVEYALSGSAKPTGVASWDVLRSALPADLAGALPSRHDLEQALVTALPSL